MLALCHILFQSLSLLAVVNPDNQHPDSPTSAGRDMGLPRVQSCSWEFSVAIVYRVLLFSLTNYQRDYVNGLLSGIYILQNQVTLMLVYLLRVC